MKLTTLVVVAALASGSSVVLSRPVDQQYSNRELAEFEVHDARAFDITSVISRASERKTSKEKEKKCPMPNKGEKGHCKKPKHPKPTPTQRPTPRPTPTHKPQPGKMTEKEDGYKVDVYN